MNQTTIEEIKEILAEGCYHEPVQCPLYIDDTTPELRAAIKNQDAFKKYLDGQK